MLSDCLVVVVEMVVVVVAEPHWPLSGTGIPLAHRHVKFPIWFWHVWFVGHNVELTKHSSISTHKGVWTWFIALFWIIINYNYLFKLQLKYFLPLFWKPGKQLQV